MGRARFHGGIRGKVGGGIRSAAKRIVPSSVHAHAPVKILPMLKNRKLFRSNLRRKFGETVERVEVNVAGENCFAVEVRSHSQAIVKFFVNSGGDVRFEVLQDASNSTAQGFKRIIERVVKS